MKLKWRHHSSGTSLSLKQSSFQPSKQSVSHTAIWHLYKQLALSLRIQAVMFPFRRIHVPFEMLYRVICHTEHLQLLLFTSEHARESFLDKLKMENGKTGHFSEDSCFIIPKPYFYSVEIVRRIRLLDSNKNVFFCCCFFSPCEPGLLQSQMSSWSLVTNLRSPKMSLSGGQTLVLYGGTLQEGNIYSHISPVAHHHSQFL